MLRGHTLCRALGSHHVYLALFTGDNWLITVLLLESTGTPQLASSSNESLASTLPVDLSGIKIGEGFMFLVVARKYGLNVRTYPFLMLLSLKISEQKCVRVSVVNFKN